MSFRAEREKAGLSVLEVARELCVSDAAVYYWETGATQPTAKNLLALAALYGCTTDDLLKPASPP